MRYLLILITVLLSVGCISAPIECKDDDCNGETEMRELPPQIHPEVPLVQVISPKGGWSQGGSLVPGSAQAISGVQVEFLKAGNYTVQFDLLDPNPDAGTLSPGDYTRAVAEISWKVNGQPIVRIVDVADGVSVTGAAEAVSVRIIDTSLVSNPTLVKPYTVVSTVVEGSRASVDKPPCLSRPKNIIGAGTTGIFAIPQNAGVISVMVTVAPTVIGTSIGAYQVLAKHSQGSGNLKVYDPRQSDFVPIMPGATDIRVTVDAAVASSVEVQVTFGIDG